MNPAGNRYRPYPRTADKLLLFLLPVRRFSLPFSCPPVLIERRITRVTRKSRAITTAKSSSPFAQEEKQSDTNEVQSSNSDQYVLPIAGEKNSLTVNRVAARRRQRDASHRSTFRVDKSTAIWKADTQASFRGILRLYRFIGASCKRSAKSHAKQSCRRGYRAVIPSDNSNLQDERNVLHFEHLPEGADDDELC